MLRDGVLARPTALQSYFDRQENARLSLAMANAVNPPCDAAVMLTGVADPSAAGAQPSGQPRVLAASILGSSMAFIDGTVVNCASCAANCAARHDFSGAVVVECYALSLSALPPPAPLGVVFLPTSAGAGVI